MVVALRRIPLVIPITAALLMAAGIAATHHADVRLQTALAQRQIVWSVVGCAAMAFAAAVPYRWLRPWSYLAYAVTTLLLLLVFLCPARNGAHRWIPCGLFDLQPSEFAKLTFVLTLAHYLMYRENYRRLGGLVAPFLLTCLPTALILREPDLGTALVFMPTLFAMLFAAGARKRHLFLVVVVFVATLPVLWQAMSSEQRSRVTTVFTQTDGGRAPAGDGYHLHQSKQVLALGGTWGQTIAGPAVDDPLAYHLPAAQTDFVFSLIGGDWGLVGTVLVLLAAMLLIGRCYTVAATTREPFARLMCVGLTTLLATQLVINAGMTVGLAPITGLTFPLVSYGGSSLVSTCGSVGLILNVAMRPGYEVTATPFRFGSSASA